MASPSTDPEMLSDRSGRLAAIDAVLVGKAAEGEQSAFDHIYDTLFPLIWSLSVRRGLLQRDAEHLTKRILGRVALSLASYPPQISFANWVRAQIAAEIRAFEGIPKRRALPTTQGTPLQP